MDITNKIDKYLSENNAPKVNSCIDKILNKHKDKKKKISYQEILRIADECRLYKDDLPDIQIGIEDEGYKIDYDN